MADAARNPEDPRSAEREPETRLTDPAALYGIGPDGAPNEPPPLEGELLCVCGQLEGLHRTDGSHPVSGCLQFVAYDDAEGRICSDAVVEYDDTAPEVR